MRLAPPETAAPALLVFVDAAGARLFPLPPAVGGDEVRIDREVQGHHRRGGWALLAQSRYQRHLQHQRDAHFAAVADTARRLAEEGGLHDLVLAGDRRNVALFRDRLPEALRTRVVAQVRGAWHEPAAVLGRRAVDALDKVRAERQRTEVNAVLALAADGGRAVCGLPSTLEAVARDAVERIYVLGDARQPGAACVACDTLHTAPAPSCLRCGGDVVPVELTTTMMERVCEAGGVATIVAAHRGLARHDGVAAVLRYPL